MDLAVRGRARAAVTHGPVTVAALAERVLAMTGQEGVAKGNVVDHPMVEPPGHRGVHVIDGEREALRPGRHIEPAEPRREVLAAAAGALGPRPAELRADRQETAVAEVRAHDRERMEVSGLAGRGAARRRGRERRDGQRASHDQHGS